MIGHVYCKFTDEEDASDALQVMNDRYYDGRKMEVEFSPVQNFQEVRVRLPSPSTGTVVSSLTCPFFTPLYYYSIRLAVEILMKRIVRGADSATLCTSNLSPYA
jgi:hypothetical protein